MKELGDRFFLRTQIQAFMSRIPLPQAVHHPLMDSMGKKFPPKLMTDVRVESAYLM